MLYSELRPLYISRQKIVLSMTAPGAITEPVSDDIPLHIEFNIDRF